jgi:hypothetical protein
MSSAPEQSAPGDAGRQYVPRPAPGYDDGDRYTEEEPRGAVLGFTVVAAILMMLSGVWNFLEGLAAIIKGSFFVVLPNYAFNASAVAWGWTHLILGAVVFLAGICLFMDLLWARITGIVLASISAIVNFLYIPYTPVWSIIVIAIDVFIIWALLVPRNRYS